MKKETIDIGEEKTIKYFKDLKKRAEKIAKKKRGNLSDFDLGSFLECLEIAYKRGFVDGYNLGCPRGEEATEDDFEDLLTPAIEKSREELLSFLKGG